MSWPRSTRLLTASRTALALSFSICARRSGSRSSIHSSSGRSLSNSGGILGDEHQSDIVYVRKKLRDGRAAPHHPGLQSTLRQGAEQVKQDNVVPIPGVQQGLEQALVVCS